MPRVYVRVKCRADSCYNLKNVSTVNLSTESQRNIIMSLSNKFSHLQSTQTAGDA